MGIGTQRDIAHPVHSRADTRRHRPFTRGEPLGQRWASEPSCDALAKNAPLFANNLILGEHRMARLVMNKIIQLVNGTWDH